MSNLRDLREQTDLTQQQLAEQARTQQHTISDYERRGLSEPGPIERIASALGVTVEQLREDPGLENPVEFEDLSPEDQTAIREGRPTSGNRLVALDSIPDEVRSQMTTRCVCCGEDHSE